VKEMMLFFRWHYDVSRFSLILVYSIYKDRPVKIKQLKLHNFRCFKEYELELDDRFTLLIGNNGSGKTAILDGLSVALGAFLLEIPGIRYTDKRHISRDDIRYEELTMGQTVIKEIEDVTIVNTIGVINNEVIEWRRYRDIKTGRRRVKPITSLIKKMIDKKTDPSTFFPIVAYYSTGRLWKQLKAPEKKIKSPSSRLEGYQNCLNPASDQKRFFSWFKTEELSSLQKGKRRHVLEAVRDAIVGMIPDAKKVWWDMDSDELRIETPIQGKLQIIPFHLLSDGYRNMIGMVADIAYRMATLNPQSEIHVIQKTEGIVLIDEIDLYLHPKWQRIVIEQLLRTFPKVQFVAGTHSPFIIQSLRQGKLIQLDENTNAEYHDLSIEDIVENIQGVELPQKSRRYLNMMAAAEAYYKKLHECNNESDAELAQLRTDLDKLTMPFSDDPAFTAQLKFERDTVLAAKGKK